MQNLDDFFEFSERPYAIHIKGHRIGPEHVLELYREGRSAEEIARFFPSLRLEDVYASILYYLLNRSQVDAYLREFEETGRRLSAASNADPSPAGRRLRELWRVRQQEKQRADALATGCPL